MTYKPSSTPCKGHCHVIEFRPPAKPSPPEEGWRWRPSLQRGSGGSRRFHIDQTALRHTQAPRRASTPHVLRNISKNNQQDHRRHGAVSSVHKTCRTRIQHFRRGGDVQGRPISRNRPGPVGTFDFGGIWITARFPPFSPRVEGRDGRAFTCPVDRRPLLSGKYRFSNTSVSLSLETPGFFKPKLWLRKRAAASARLFSFPAKARLPREALFHSAGRPKVCPMPWVICFPRKCAHNYCRSRRYNTRMCGRYTLRRYDLWPAPPVRRDAAAKLPFEEVQRARITGRDFNIAPSPNRGQTGFASTAKAIVCSARQKWGLIPLVDEIEGRRWRPINARAENPSHRAACFRQAFARRRCLIPADGYLRVAGEVRAAKSRAVFLIFIGRDDRLFFFFSRSAGLWERWNDSDSGKPVGYVHDHHDWSQ